MKKIFDKCESFQWDEGNSTKNWIKHNVTVSECEQVFFNKPIIIDSIQKETNEKRWYLLGRTDENKELFVVFTIRRKQIRIISARNMSKKERVIYHEEVKKHSKI
jgi:uncharacterized DUF497 family protein